MDWKAFFLAMLRKLLEELLTHVPKTGTDEPAAVVKLRETIAEMEKLP